jgi:hypothetical protein
VYTPPPAFGAGGGHTRWGERGWGVNILEDARHSTYVSIYCALAFTNRLFIKEDM